MDQRYGDTKLLACAKRWSGVLQIPNWSGVFETPNWSEVLETPNWSGVLETPNWSGVLIEHMNRGVFQSPVGPIVPSCT